MSQEPKRSPQLLRAMAAIRSMWPAEDTPSLDMIQAVERALRAADDAGAVVSVAMLQRANNIADRALAVAEEMAGHMKAVLDAASERQAPMGCICPPGAEATCGNPLCNRKPPLRAQP